MKTEKNVLGGELRACSYAPLTGYFRDGCCATHDQDGVAAAPGHLKSRLEKMNVAARSSAAMYANPYSVVVIR